MVIADFEAGTSTMSRTDAKVLDLAIVVVEPYMKSIDTAKRLIEMVGTAKNRRTVLVANKVRDDEDLAFIRTKLDGLEPDFIIPDDKEIAEADLEAISPMDRNPDSPAVKAIRQLAGELAA